MGTSPATPQSPYPHRTVSYLITFSPIPNLPGSPYAQTTSPSGGRAPSYIYPPDYVYDEPESPRRAMKNWRTSLRRFITTVGYFSQLGVQDILKRWNKRWKSEEKKLTGSLNDRAVKRQLGVSSPLLCFETFQIRNGRDGAAYQNLSAVHSFGFSRSLHFNLVREYTGDL